MFICSHPIDHTASAVGTVAGHVSEHLSKMGWDIKQTDAPGTRFLITPSLICRELLWGCFWPIHLHSLFGHYARAAGFSPLALHRTPLPVPTSLSLVCTLPAPASLSLL